MPGLSVSRVLCHPHQHISQFSILALSRFHVVNQHNHTSLQVALLGIDSSSPRPPPQRPVVLRDPVPPEIAYNPPPVTDLVSAV